MSSYQQQQPTSTTADDGDGNDNNCSLPPPGYESSTTTDAPVPLPGTTTAVPPLPHEPPVGDASSRQERKLFVGGLPSSCDKEQFDMHFGQFGSIKDSIVMTDRVTGRTRGFGFVTYTTLDATELCLASGPHVLMDKMVDVKRATIQGPPPPQHSNRGGDFMSPPSGGMFGGSDGGSMGKGRGPSMYDDGYGDMYPPAAGGRVSMPPPSSPFNDGSGYNPCKLFIGGIPSDMDQVRLDQFFCRYGNIVDSVVMKDRITGRPRGFAYVTYSTPEEAQAAMDAGDANVLDGKWVDVKIATRGSSAPGSASSPSGPPPGFSPLPFHRGSSAPIDTGSGPGPLRHYPQPRSSSGPPLPDGSGSVAGDNPSKVFIGGVPTSVDNGQLQEVMSQYGSVVDCIIMTDRMTGRPRGFAYCTYTTPEEAQAACNGGSNNSIDGHWLDVKPATRDPAICGPGRSSSRGGRPPMDHHDHNRHQFGYQARGFGSPYGQSRGEGSFGRDGRYDMAYNNQGMYPYPQQYPTRTPYGMPQQQQTSPYPPQQQQPQAIHPASVVWTSSSSSSTTAPARRSVLDNHHERLFHIRGDTFRELGRNLSAAVGKRTRKAFQDDLEVWTSLDLVKKWQTIASAAARATKHLSPSLYDFFEGMDESLSSPEVGLGGSVWQLLTMYEMDMYVYRYAARCSVCSSRIMDIPRRKCMCRSWCNKCYKAASKPQFCDICKFAVREVHQIEPSKKMGTEGVDQASTTLLHDKTGGANCCCSPRVVKGRCTGFGSPRSGICAQTVDMSCDTYNHGRDDACYLINLPTGHRDWALVYDVGCIASPIGINSRGVAMCLYNLYNTAGHGYERALADSSTKESAEVLPMAVLQWAVLLGELDTIEKIEGMLRKALRDIGLYTSAALVITCTNNPGEVLEAEMAGNDIWTRVVEAAGGDEDKEKGMVIRANHSQPTSSIKPTEDIPKDVSESSHDRLTKLTESLVAAAPAGATNEHQCNKEPRLSTDGVVPANISAREVLSQEPIQEDDTLATVVLRPREGIMDIRFKLGTRIKVTIKRGTWLQFGGGDDNNVHGGD
ncbi:hypothetical protein FOL46_005514 [Perkinsus olseni]|uniref:RRM domain-containing protein n=1 Tax=Perkinsus olseni TaxID=32597 RepID=A0A7J6LRQ1_PEROL|nr:hypothetical protein FOL46_005514 [Perkinsus olseni]